MPPRLASVQVGRIAPLRRGAVPSGFKKSAATGRVLVTEMGLAGDEQADLSVHGGAEKAVYGYAARHYADWQTDFPQHADRLVAGSMGENLTIDGLDEKGIFVGDVHGIGTALLQVCQPRQPCFKLGLAFDDPKLLKAMVRSGRAGWYYRVLQTGELAAGDTVRLVERPCPDFGFERLVEIVNNRCATVHELKLLSTMPELASSLRQIAVDFAAPTPT